jgi:putative DNA primase/helicase
MLDFNDAPVQRDWDTIDLRAERDRIRTRLLAQLRPLLQWVFPHGTIRGRKFHVGNLQGDPGDSLEIELEGDKAGLGYDHATGESGDLFDFIARREGLDVKRDFPRVLIAAERWLGGDWLALSPVTRAPRKDKSPPIDELGPHTAKWDYWSADRKLLACVYRYDPPTGKQFRPRDVVRGMTGTPSIRPLYNLPGIASAEEVVLVEGEKCAQALIDYGVCATTLMGGANAPVDKTDLTPLVGKRLLIWPDKDKPGWDYAERVAKASLAAGASSFAILEPPADKPESWDAADAIAEGFDWQAFLNQGPRQAPLPTEPRLPFYSLGELLDDCSPVPPDLIAPRVMTVGGLLVLGGAPKVGKSDFLLSWLAHMAAGAEFLGMRPCRPLRVFYLQAEVQYHYLRERVKAIRLPAHRLLDARQNFIATPQLRLILNDEGLARIIPAVTQAFGGQPADLIVIDPIRNVFDGGDAGGENDNAAMLFFLSQRVERIRDAVNPEAGIILAHHTRKLGKKQFEEDPFQALAGAGSLRGYYSTGLLLFRPDETRTERQLIFELRNGPGIPSKHIDKIHGEWREVLPSERLVLREHGQRLDAERLRKQEVILQLIFEVILQLIFEEAAQGRCYTPNQFAEAFEGKAGLGANRTINERLSVFATKGYVKYFRNPEDYGLPPLTRSKYGYLCVEDMVLWLPHGVPDPDTGELPIMALPVRPTDYKCPRTGALLPVENPDIWIYQEELDA